jgi:hypothetical protein
MSAGAQNKKMGPGVPVTAENQSLRAKHQKGTLRSRYRRKRVWAQNMKTGPDAPVPPKKSSGAQYVKTGPYALGTAKNESGSAKHENGTRRPRYRRKRVEERKTRKRVPVPPETIPGHKTRKQENPTPPVPSKTSRRAQNIKTESDALGIAENDSGS